MKEITMLLDRISTDTLTSSELTSFVKIMREQIQSGMPGYEKVSKEDIQWFETYAYALKKYELFRSGEGYDIKGGDWREVIQDVSKLKILVDDLEEKKLVNNVTWYIDGIALFDIPELATYKKMVLGKIRTHLETFMD